MRHVYKGVYKTAVISSTSKWTGLLLVILTTLAAHKELLVSLLGSRGELLFVIVNVLISVLGYLGVTYHRYKGDTKEKIHDRYEKRRLILNERRARYEEKFN